VDEKLIKAEAATEEATAEQVQFVFAEPVANVDIRLLRHAPTLFFPERQG
jgi:hypothetical protein